MQQSPPSGSPGSISPDGQWMWNGASWDPNPNRPGPAIAAKAQHTFRNIGCGCLGILLLFIVIGVAMSSGKPSTSSPAVADKQTAAPAPAQSTQAPAPAATKVLLDVTGSGTKKTQKFTAAGDWDLEWSYDCSNYASKGNFIVAVYDNNNSPTSVAVNEIGAKGADVTHQHDSGTFYLDMNSECNWHVVVKG